MDESSLLPDAVPQLNFLTPDQRRRDRRGKNDRLFAAVKEALAPTSYPMVPLEKRLDHLRRAIVDGGDVNARATLVEFHKARPLGMVAHWLHASPDAVKVLDVLLKHGANMNVLDRHGNTFTHDLVGLLWGSRVNPTSLENLQHWLDRGGSAHLLQKNRQNDTPLSLLCDGYFGTSVHPQRAETQALVKALVDALVNAGARADDLPPDLLHTLLKKNNRAGFDVAVELGLDVQQRVQGKNLWSTWSQTYMGYHANGLSATTRQAWMERLIELGVDLHAAVDPAQSSIKTSTTSVSSALLVNLEASLRMIRLDEVCLARLKALGCAWQTPDNNPVHALAAAAQVEHLRSLHRLGFDLAGARNPRGETLLQVACCADLRGTIKYKEIPRTVHDTVAVLLEAGCDPNVTAGPDSKLDTPLWETIVNRKNAREDLDRAQTVERLVAGGAKLDDRALSAKMIGHLVFPHHFANVSVPGAGNEKSWKSVSYEELDTVKALLGYGASVPARLTPSGAPVLACLILSSMNSTPMFRERYDNLWSMLVAHEETGWENRLACDTLHWLGWGSGSTKVSDDQAVAMIDAMAKKGVPESAWSSASQAYKGTLSPDRPLARRLEAAELREVARLNQPDPSVLLARTPRARL